MKAEKYLTEKRFIEILKERESKKIIKLNYSCLLLVLTLVIMGISYFVLGYIVGKYT